MPPRFQRRSPAAVSFMHGVLACAAVSLVLAPPTCALAWCRASAEVGQNGACVPNPTAPLLFWKRSCIAYSFNTEFFRELRSMNEREVRSAFQAGFDAWAKVDCDGQAAFFVEQLTATTSTAASEYKRGGQNESVVVAIERERWATLPDHSERAVALTLMWHNRVTGELLDTDIELNLGAGSFADCVAGSCNAGMVDLQNTITHEAGHVLGLGHSTDTSATMTAQTVGTVDTQKRSLSPDDIVGYCSLGLPDALCTGASCSCAETLAAAQAESMQRRTGCAVSAPGASGASRIWILAVLACIRRLRLSRC